MAANKTALTKRLVVLVDGNSASASEILAGASKTTGQRSLAVFGKALVQAVHSLGRFWVGGNSCPLLHSQGNGYKPQRDYP